MQKKLMKLADIKHELDKQRSDKNESDKNKQQTCQRI